MTMTKEERAAARATKGNSAKTTKKQPVRKAKVAAEKPAKAAKPAAAKKPAKVSRIESSSETVREIVRLASRKEGATAAELEAASGWKNAGWPWMFFNKNTGKGIAPRHNMKLVIIERPAAEGERARKAYHLAPL